MTEDVPDREEFRHAPIEHARVTAGMTVGDLADEYGNAGIGAANLSTAVDITGEMLGRDDVTVLLGLAGAMVPAGMRRIVSDLVRDGYVDALVTTGANLTHDAIEAIGGKHHHGRAHPSDVHPVADDDAHPVADDDAHPVVDAAEHPTAEGDDHSFPEITESTGNTLREHDERLRDEWVDRIYNVYLPQEYFTTFENHLRDEVFPALERTVTIQELTAELGRANLDVNDRDDVDEDPGIAAAAYECDVPIYAPAIQDSVLGLQAWMYSQTSEFTLDALGDMTHLTDLAFDAESTGALIVGGGVPKNYVLQTMLVAPSAYDYAVQLTTDPDHTGGLTGATLDEARSWGKLEKTAANATVVGDATITFPLLVAAARERIET